MSRVRAIGTVEVCHAFKHNLSFLRAVSHSIVAFSGPQIPTDLLLPFEEPARHDRAAVEVLQLVMERFNHLHVS
jgi:hypothetical protein